ncbi:hypothetical protein AT727_02655 [Desulfitobacterium hafniense]|uniref:O-antigen polymerase n=1 Tax=Desulfitobacterium hafniense TaxID=49338 RepID=A0A0W1JQR1_DESHA|nr:hypothetical protein [Desulfitobacterium hafniense]KTE93874.1 hypothetical protein AT727_02655 [Desulfitobacterium hafniense]
MKFKFINLSTISLSILFFIQSLAVFQPDVFTYIPWTNFVLNILRSILLISSMYRFFSYNHKINLYLITLVCMCLSIIIATIATDFGIYNVFVYCAKYLLCFFWTYEGYTRYKDKFIFKLSDYFTICVILNTISIIIWPDGIFRDDANQMIFFLGGKNVMALSIIMAVILRTYRILSEKKRIISLMNILVIAASIYSAFFNHGGVAGTLILGIFLFILLSFFVRISNISVNPYITFFGYIFFWFLLVEWGIGEYLSWLSEIVGKDITFTGRFYVWQETIKQIKESFLFGYGSLNIDYALGYSAHNGILHMIHMWGIFSVFFGLMLIFLTLLNICRCRAIKCKILALGILTVLTMSLMETYLWSNEFIVLYVLSYIVGRGNLGEESYN